VGLERLQFMSHVLTPPFLIISLFSLYSRIASVVHGSLILLICLLTPFGLITFVTGYISGTSAHGLHFGHNRPLMAVCNKMLCLEISLALLIGVYIYMNEDCFYH